MAMTAIPRPACTIPPVAEVVAMSGVPAYMVSGVPGDADRRKG
jgi:hypothetical protein